MSGSEILLWMIGAVTLILWSVRMIRTGMSRAFGSKLHAVMGKLAKRRMAAYAAGILVTIALQSSTATSLIVASLAHQGALSTSAGLAIMLGADVGTTLAAQFLSFKVHWLAPLFITIGYITFNAHEGGPKKHFGRVLIGLGLLMLALRIIMQSSEPLRGNEVVAEVIQSLSKEPLLCLLVGAIMTWLAHSSLAIVLLTMSLADGGTLTPVAALTLVLGANLGGTFAPLFATAGQGVAARRIPAANCFVRLIGVLIALPLIGYAVEWLSMIDKDHARLVVNFHTGFNIILSILALPFCQTVGRFLERIIPDTPPIDDGSQPLYLDERLLETPGVAIAAAAREARRMADVMAAMLHKTMICLRQGDERLIEEIRTTDNIIDRLNEAIKLYVTKIARQELDTEDSARAMEIIAFVTHLEHAGDIIDKNLMDLAGKKLKSGVSFSREGIGEIETLHAGITRSLDLAIGAFTARDPEIAKRLIARKTEMRELERRSYDAHLARLTAGNPDTIKSSSLHLDIVRDLKVMHAQFVGIAHAILTPSVMPERIAPASDPAPE